MHRLDLPIAAIAVMLAGMVSGCSPWGAGVSQAEHDKVLYQLNTAHDRIKTLDKANNQLKLTLGDKDKQIHTLQGLGDKRLEQVFHVQRIEFGSYTGGVNLDDKDGDEGIRVYLHPIDQAGSTIKAAGSVKIQLYDLAAKPDKNLLGEYKWTAAQAAKNWTSFLVHHYNFTCRWKSAQPAHDKITIRAEFVDYLTGKHFTVQKTCKIQLASPPTAPPATAPRRKS